MAVGEPPERSAKRTSKKQESDNVVEEQPSL